MILNLGVSLEGREDMQIALSTLKLSIQKQIVASAVRSAAGPIATDLRKQLRHISRASPRGTFTLAKNIRTRISRSKTGIPTVKSITGARRRVVGPEISSIPNPRHKHRLRKPLPSQKDEGPLATQKKVSGKTKFRVPTRYFHFLERGFTNWQTGRRIPPKAPMRIAIHRNRAESARRFEETFWRGIIRESLRGGAYIHQPTLET